MSLQCFTIHLQHFIHSIRYANGFDQMIFLKSEDADQSVYNAGLCTRGIFFQEES